MTLLETPHSHLNSDLLAEVDIRLGFLGRNHIAEFHESVDHLLAGGMVNLGGLAVSSKPGGVREVGDDPVNGFEMLGDDGVGLGGEEFDGIGAEVVVDALDGSANVDDVAGGLSSDVLVG